MATLLFFVTFLFLLVLVITLIALILKRKSSDRTLKTMAFVICGYTALWLLFYLKSSYTSIPFGTDVCFDDWCATVTKVNKEQDISGQFRFFSPDSSYIVLHITMSNHAKGIAQKPSEPRIFLVDEKGFFWGYSIKETKVLEKAIGKQPGIDQKLELHESLQTQMVFAIPSKTRSYKILIEEGPFITKLLLPEDQKVFLIQ